MFYLYNLILLGEFNSFEFLHLFLLSLLTGIRVFLDSNDACFKNKHFSIITRVYKTAAVSKGGKESKNSRPLNQWHNRRFYQTKTMITLLPCPPAPARHITANHSKSNTLCQKGCLSTKRCCQIAGQAVNHLLFSFFRANYRCWLTVARIRRCLLHITANCQNTRRLIVTATRH